MIADRVPLWAGGDNPWITLIRHHNKHMHEASGVISPSVTTYNSNQKKMCARTLFALTLRVLSVLQCDLDAANE
jgi:hypothetical protein